jgi:Cu+-exporting ATPase
VIHVKASRVGDDSTLYQIIKLVSDAQVSKAPIQDLADWVAGYFVPSIIILAALTLIIWSFFVPFFDALVFSISVVVVACPCALGMSNAF